MCLTSKKANYTENEKLYKALSKVYFIVNPENTEYLNKINNNPKN